MGIGISGGEHGARTGPSIMPGGDPEAYAQVKHILGSGVAKVDGVCVPISEMCRRSLCENVQTVSNMRLCS